MRTYLGNLSLALVIILTACGGGSGPSSGLSTPGLPVTTGNPAISESQLVATSFAVGLPRVSASTAKRRSQYLGAGAASVSITLDTVNGTSAPSGLTRTVITSITPANCPCTVSGPLVPPGSDGFTFTTYDAPNGTGNVLATATGAFTIADGSANGGTPVTLLGVPSILVFGSAGTGSLPVAGGSLAIPLTVEDADQNAIVGTYATPVTIVNSDTSGATSVSTAGSDNPPSGELLGSTDTLSIVRSGLIMPQATLTASAIGAPSATYTIGPFLSSILYSGPLNGSGAPEVDLYAPTGSGSTATFSASDAGWTNAPFDRGLTASSTGCSSIGHVSPSSGTSFTFTAVPSPFAGSCTITLSDGIDPALTITATYTTTGFGVN